MRKLIIIILFLSAVVSAQQNYDFTAYRGDSTQVSFPSVKGDLTSHSFQFVVKRNLNRTGDALIEITTVTKTYSASTLRTNLSLAISGTETQDLDSVNYVYDLYDMTSKKTLFFGNFTINQDVGNPYMGVNLIASATRYIPVDTSKITNGFIVRRVGNNFVGYDLLTNHYTKTQDNLLLAAKLNLADSTTKYISPLFLSTNYRTALAQDQLNALKAPLISPSFTTPSLGVATGTSLTLTKKINAGNESMWMKYKEPVISTNVSSDILYGYHDDFGFICELPNNKIAHFYLRSSSHSGFKKLMMQTSDDGGKSFKDSLNINTITDAMFTVGGGVTPTGRIVLFYGSSGTLCKYIYSDDYGITWTTPATFSNSGLAGTSSSPYGKMISIGSNQLMMGYYEEKHPGTSYIRIRTSADDGATWGNPITVYADTTDINETAFAYIGSQQIIGISRHDSGTDQSSSMFVSSNNGVTWTNLGQVAFDGTSKQMSPWIEKYSDGSDDYLIYFYTTTDTKYIIAQSNKIFDLGLIGWSAMSPISIGGIGHHASAIIRGNTALVVSHSEYDANTKTRIKFQKLTLPKVGTSTSYYYVSNYIKKYYAGSNSAGLFIGNITGGIYGTAFHTIDKSYLSFGTNSANDFSIDTLHNVIIGSFGTNYGSTYKFQLTGRSYIRSTTNQYITTVSDGTYSIATYIGQPISAVNGAALTTLGSYDLFLGTNQVGSYWRLKADGNMVTSGGSLTLGTTVGTGTGALYVGAATATSFTSTSTSVLSISRNSSERANISIDENSTGLTIKTVTDLPLRFGTTNAIRWRMQYGNGYLLGEQTANLIGVNTLDGSDTGYLMLSGASLASTSRSGTIGLFGNESTSLNPSYYGDVHIFSGEGGQVWIGYTTSGGVAQDAIGVQNNGIVNLYGITQAQKFEVGRGITSGLPFTVTNSAGTTKASIDSIGNQISNSFTVNGSFVDNNDVRGIYSNATWSNTSYSHHPVRIQTFHTLGTGQSLAVFDAQPTTQGTNDNGHIVSFQGRATHGSSGTLQQMYGLYNTLTNNGGLVTSGENIHISNAEGSGSFTTQYGILIDTLTKGSTNWAIYTQGSTPSYLGGNVTVGGNLYATNVYSSGALSFYSNSAMTWQINGSGTLYPVANNSYDLGHTSYRIKDAYFASTINLTSGGFFYLAGNSTTDGSWRLGSTTSGSMKIEKRVSGSWVTASELTY